MTHIVNLGRRLELVPIDAHFHEISISLYHQVDADGGNRFRVHSYTSRAGADQRLGTLIDTMKVLGGMEAPAGSRHELRFPCGQAHIQACKRVFLEACKIPLAGPVQARELAILDKKIDREIHAGNLGGGAYRLTAEGTDSDVRKRVAGVARGLVKLAGMENAEDNPYDVAFECGHGHDALVGLLLGRALNARAAMREAEMAANRGILSAPSAQQP